MTTLDIPLAALAALYALLAIPLLIVWKTGLRLNRDILVSVLRMTGQLGLVGLYLKYIFAWNSIWINLLWIAAVTTVANVNVLQRAGLMVRRFFWPTLLGISCGAFLVVGVFLLVLVRPEPLYDARYLIPITGMVLGNCLRGNVLVLERFYAALKKSESEFFTYLMLGATLREAVAPYLRQALHAALAPNIATMMTIGIVSLPGMMTGQILGGSFPVVAIKYQIAIMLSIFISLTLSATMNVILSLPVAFDGYDLLRDDVFSGGRRR